MATIRNAYLALLVAWLPVSATADGEFSVALAAPLQFHSEIVRGPLTKADIDRLLDLKVDEFQFTEGGRRFSVENCRQFLRVDRGMFSTSYRLMMASRFNKICGTLSAVNRARQHKKTFLQAPRVKVSDLHLLPVDLLPVMTNEEQDKLIKLSAAGKSFRDFVASETTVVKKQTPISLEVDYEGMTLSLEEIARADFDHDGLEDILVYVLESAQPGQGDHVRGGTYLFTRNNFSERFTIKTYAFR